MSFFFLPVLSLLCLVPCRCVMCTCERKINVSDSAHAGPFGPFGLSYEKRRNRPKNHYERAFAIRGTRARSAPFFCGIKTEYDKKQAYQLKFATHAVRNRLQFLLFMTTFQLDKIDAHNPVWEAGDFRVNSPF